MFRNVSWFTHYSQRRLEWLLAFYTLFFGVMISMPPDSMTSSGFTMALALMPEWGWGTIYIVVGNRP